MRKVEDNNKITQNVDKRRCLHNIHESRQRLSSTASGYGNSVCACSQNCYSVKAERIRVNGACYVWPRVTLYPPLPYIYQANVFDPPQMSFHLYFFAIFISLWGSIHDSGVTVDCWSNHNASRPPAPPPPRQLQTCPPLMHDRVAAWWAPTHNPGFAGATMMGTPYRIFVN